MKHTSAPNRASRGNDPSWAAALLNPSYWAAAVALCVGTAAVSCGQAAGPGGVGPGGDTGAGSTTSDLQCGAGMTLCNGQCVNTLADVYNCSGCGQACPLGQACVNGACQCASGLSPCGASCVNLQGDGNNCGTCGTVCPQGLVCSFGQCTSSGCADGLTQCNSSCVNTAADLAHCGVCDNACPANATCSNGTCTCAANMSLCNGACVSTLTDVNNCGGCNVKCGTDQTCNSGTCACQPGKSSCSGACVDTQTDSANCGGCGNACPGGTTCSGGVCATTSTTNTGGGPSATGGAPSTGGGPSATGGAPSTGGGPGSGGGPSTGGAAGSTGGGPTAGTGGGGSTDECADETERLFSFFLISHEALTRLSGSTDGFGGDLGGLAGADAKCQATAEYVSECQKTRVWRAFLSTTTAHAIDRIGTGPWHDRMGRLLANNISELLNERPPNADPIIINDFPNEYGIPNHNPTQVAGADVDNHEIITGTGTDGRLYNQSGTTTGTTTGGFPTGGFVMPGGSTSCGPNNEETWSPEAATCWGWTTSEPKGCPRVGHSWPNQMSGVGWISVWNEGGCAPGGVLTNEGPNGGGLDGTRRIGSAGGYGGFYCFAVVN